MTTLQSLEKRFKEEKEKLKEECKPGIQFIRDCAKVNNYISGSCFEHLFKERFNLKINRIQLMDVSTDSKKQFYQQFLIEFEDNTVEYVYVLIGD